MRRTMYLYPLYVRHDGYMERHRMSNRRSRISRRVSSPCTLWRRNPAVTDAAPPRCAPVRVRNAPATDPSAPLECVVLASTSARLTLASGQLAGDADGLFVPEVSPLSPLEPFDCGSRALAVSAAALTRGSPVGSLWLRARRAIAGREFNGTADSSNSNGTDTYAWGEEWSQPMEVRLNVRCAPGYVKEATSSGEGACAPCPAGTFNQPGLYNQVLAPSLNNNKSLINMVYRN
eukprot:9230992-Pyramimonas_sp.AAC.2